VKRNFGALKKINLYGGSLLQKIAAAYRRHFIFANYSAASVFLSVIDMAAGLLVLRWVAPKEYGLWQSLLIIHSYTALVQAGIINGLNRELPYEFGKENRAAVVRLAGTAQGIAFFGAGLLFAAACIAPLFISSRVVAWSLAIILICNGIDIIRNYLGSTYRAGRDFAALSKLTLYEAALSIFSLPLVYFLGYWGLVGRIAFMRIAAFIPFYFFRPLKVVSCFNRQAAVQLLKVGIPIFIYGYFFGIADTFPKIILLQCSGPELVGLFAPASALMGLYIMFPGIVAKYIYPHMTFQLGKTDDPRSLWPMAWKSAVGSLAIGIPCLIAGWIVVAPLVNAFFPKYSASIPAAYWCLFAGIFLGPRIAVNALFSLKAWKWATIYTAVLVVSGWVFPWLGSVYNADPLVGVAQGICLSYAAIFFCAMICLYKATHAPLRA